MAIDPGENFERFPQSYSFAAWYTANRGHEAMETLETAAWLGTSDSKTAAVDEVC